MAERPDQKFIILNDFKPGIFADFHYGGGATSDQNQPGSLIGLNGAATIENTYRCGADMTGALIPLPRLTPGPTRGVWPGQFDEEGMEGHPTTMQADYILDAFIRDDISHRTTVGAGPNRRFNLYIMWSYMYDHGGANGLHLYYHAEVFREYASATPGSVVVGLGWSRREANSVVPSVYPPVLPSGNFAPAFNTIEVAWVTAFPYVFWGIERFFVNYRRTISNDDWAVTPDAEELPGPNALGDFTGGPDYQIGSYPNTSSTVPNYANGVNNSPRSVRIAFQHQGRHCFVHGSIVNHGGGDIIADEILYWPVGEWDPAGTLDTHRLIAGDDNLTGVGAVISTSADELFIVKHSGGGYLIRGDLDNPTVSKLPFIESTQGVTLLPVSCPLGIAYGSRNGIYLWTGGETSEYISPQLEGWFWDHHDHSEIIYSGIQGRLAYWHPYLCVPNNYLYDARHKSWWRLDEPFLQPTEGEELAPDIPNEHIPFHCYQVLQHSEHRLLAFPYKHTILNNELWWEAVQSTLSLSYSWQSQPLVESIDRTLSMEYVKLVATSTSSQESHVDVTLDGYDKDGLLIHSQVVPFTLPPQTRPQLVPVTPKATPTQHRRRLEPHFQASYIRVRIVSTSTEVAAPKVHSLSIAYREVNELPFENT